MRIEECEVGKEVIYRKEGVVITEVDRNNERVFVAPTIKHKEHQKEVPAFTLEPKQ